MYADFESILEPISGPVPNLQISSTRGVNIHTPSGWCVRSEFAYGEVKDPLKLYRGKDCVSKFCEHIIGEACRLYSSFPEKPMIPLTKDQIKKYNRASKCHICFKHFKDGDRKVRDHCHYSGIDLKKRTFLLRIPSIAPSQCLELVRQIMNMPSKFGERLELITWESTTICT